MPQTVEIVDIAEWWANALCYHLSSVGKIFGMSPYEGVSGG